MILFIYGSRKKYSELSERIHQLIDKIKNGSYQHLRWVYCTLAQYRICVSVLSDYFKSVKNQSWEKDGVGMCHANEHEFDTHLVAWSSIANKLEEMKQRLLDKMGRSIFDPVHRNCIYHQEWVGCILWDLKSPRCVTAIDWNVHVEYDYSKLIELLKSIQMAWAKEEELYQIERPEENWQLVIEFLREVEKYL